MDAWHEYPNYLSYLVSLCMHKVVICATEDFRKASPMSDVYATSCSPGVFKQLSILKQSQIP